MVSANRPQAFVEVLLRIPLAAHLTQLKPLRHPNIFYNLRLKHAVWYGDYMDQFALVRDESVETASLNIKTESSALSGHFIPMVRDVQKMKDRSFPALRQLQVTVQDVEGTRGPIMCTFVLADYREWVIQ